MFYLLVACTVRKMETSRQKKKAPCTLFFVFFCCILCFCCFFSAQRKNVQIPSGTNVKASVFRPSRPPGGDQGTVWGLENTEDDFLSADVDVRAWTSHLTSPSSSALAVVLTQALLGLELLQPLRRLLAAQGDRERLASLASGLTVSDPRAAKLKVRRRH